MVEIETGILMLSGGSVTVMTKKESKRRCGAKA